ncbi:MAG: hypothetical protein KY429_07805 [Actinobacteria bacterium]|nr:hypothetical protein [Actinomycetota bacterium]
MERSTITRGIVGGLVGGIVMAMFAMIAGATYLGTGFFTPMYHIAAFLIGPEEMKSSMDGGTFYFSAGPAALGMMIHMVTAIGWGVLFALLVSRIRIGGASLILLGAIYGLAVMAFMSFIALPIIGQGDMPTMVGWPTFSIEHVLYGATLGAWLGLAGVRSRALEPEIAAGGIPVR